MQNEKLHEQNEHNRRKADQKRPCMAIQKGFEKWVSLTSPHNAVLYYLANFFGHFAVCKYTQSEPRQRRSAYSPNATHSQVITFICGIV
jgi:hypothetical protein